MSDFAFVGRYAIYHLDFTVVDGNGSTVASDSPPVASFRDYATDVELFSRAAASTVDVGVYRLTLSSAETEDPGLFYVRWTYNLSTVPQVYRTDIEIASSATSAYESLPDDARAAVDRTWLRFADMFDSAIGGPHLKEYAQSSFGRDRIADLLSLGLDRLNIMSSPHASHTLVSFPYNAWSGLLELATYVQVIKHLIRSYLEQPQAQGVQTARLDRRDYFERWQAMLRLEEADLAKGLDLYRIASYGLGNSSVLVSGGAYGEWQRPVGPARGRRLPPTGWWR